MGPVGATALSRISAEFFGGTRYDAYRSQAPILRCLPFGATQKLRP